MHDHILNMILHTVKLPASLMKFCAIICENCKKVVYNKWHQS